MAKSKLDTCTNIIDLFAYLGGDWIVPEEFLRWSAVSLIAACVEDRVWYNVVEHASLYPNVWVFLIGPSGTGKDFSIGMALSLLKREDHLWIIDGKVTIPALYDYMARQQRVHGKQSAPVYLISADVTEQLPTGTEALDFTSRSLALYGGRERVLNDITRSSGDKNVKNPLLNWCAGCTREWFPRAIDPLAFNSGFAGRAFFIIGEPVLENFHKDRPTRHHDHDLVMDHLRKRIEDLLAVEGLFVMTEKAHLFYNQWLYQQEERLRTTQLTDVEKNVMGRTRTSAYKLAMIYSLADWQAGQLLIIKARHMQHAIRTVQASIKSLVDVGNFAYVTPDTAVFDKIREVIKTTGCVRRDALSRFAYRRGVRNKNHLDEILESLKDSNQIEVEVRPPGRKGGPPSRYYKWKPRKIILKDREESKDEHATESTAGDTSTDADGEAS